MGDDVAVRGSVTRRGTRGAMVATLVLAGATWGCSNDPSFAVGDCVRIERRILDSDLKAASCDGAVGTFDADQRVYRVNEVIDGTDGSCPRLSGFFPVEFSHGPDDVTYCLVQES